MASTALASVNSFGEMLRHLRQRARLTQEEFGPADPALAYAVAG